MAEQMEFPATFDEFAEQYKIVDIQEIYTNGSELIPVFRVRQWLENADSETSTTITRRSVLEDAIKCVCTDRNQQYGEPEDNFAVIASLWGSYLAEDISAHDVAIMMALFKVGRIMTGTDKDDSYVDACGYLACAAEIAMREGDA